MYATVVLGVEHHEFEDVLEHYKAEKSLVLDTDLTAADWRTSSAQYKTIVEKRLPALSAGAARAIVGRDRRSVLSWMNHRAHHLSEAA